MDGPQILLWVLIIGMVAIALIGSLGDRKRDEKRHNLITRLRPSRELNTIHLMEMPKNKVHDFYEDLTYLRGTYRIYENHLVVVDLKDGVWVGFRTAINEGVLNWCGFQKSERIRSPFIDVRHNLFPQPVVTYNHKFEVYPYWFQLGWRGVQKREWKQWGELQDQFEAEQTPANA